MFESQFWIFVRTYTPSVTLGVMLFLMYAASQVEIGMLNMEYGKWNAEIQALAGRGLSSISQLAGVAARESFVPATSASSTVATSSAQTSASSTASIAPTPEPTHIAKTPVQEPLDLPVTPASKQKPALHQPLIPISTTAIPVLPGQGGAGSISTPPSQPVAVQTPPPPAPTPTPAPKPKPTPVATSTPKPALTPQPAPKPVPVPTPTPAGKVLFTDSFAHYPKGIITNEYSHWNPSDAAAHASENWEMTAGSLFARNGVAWSGVPDSGIEPDPVSSNANNSAIFRLTTKRANFGNVSVGFDLRVLNLTSTTPTPVVDWDGVHVFLRYQSQYHLYYASVNRRDNTVIIKKKIPGGPSNNGTYYNLSQGGIRYALPFNTWQHVEARVKDLADGAVSIELYADGKLLTKAIDNGTIGGAPIRGAGKVGIRADNAQLEFKNFTVSAL